MVVAQSPPVKALLAATRWALRCCCSSPPLSPKPSGGFDPVPALSPQTVSNVAWALAKLAAGWTGQRHPREQGTHSVAATSTWQQHSMEASRSDGDATDGGAEREVTPVYTWWYGEEFDLLARAALPLVPSFQPQHVSNLAAAFALMRHEPHPALLRALMGRTAELLERQAGERGVGEGARSRAERQSVSDALERQARAVGIALRCSAERDGGTEVRERQGDEVEEGEQFRYFAQQVRCLSADGLCRGDAPAARATLLCRNPAAQPTVHSQRC